MNNYGLLKGLICGLALMPLTPAGAQDLSPKALWVQGDVAGETSQPSDRFGEAVASGDFNNDGYDDLAVGAPFENTPSATNVGNVAVFYGSAAGLAAAAAEIYDQATVFLSINEAGDLFGSALVVGDFNGDSFDDLAVSAPDEDLGAAVDTGYVAVYYGSASGLSTVTEAISQSSLSDSFNEDNDRFGWSLAAADFDADGYDDLVVGAPFEDIGGVGVVVDTGIIGVFYGSSAGIQSDDAALNTRSQPLSQTSLESTSNSAGDLMGYSLSAGDFDRDGFADLAVGIPGKDLDGLADVGMVGVFYGSGSGLKTTSTEIFSQGSLIDQTNETGDQFAWSLASGDFNGDGFLDLAAGIPFENIGGLTDGGTIGVFFGSADGLFPTLSESFTQISAGGSNGSSDKVGHSLWGADFDGDGIDDLVAGLPFKNTPGGVDAGSLMMFFGSDMGLLPARAFYLSQLSFGGAEARSDEFGEALTSGDFDGNGLTDLAVGSPRDNVGTVVDAGTVFVGTLQDSDGDRLVDVLETGVLGTDPSKADTDGDGTDDRHELLAGTDPLDPASRPGIVAVAYDSGGVEVTLTWTSAPGRIYAVEWSPNLREASWAPLEGGTEVPAAEGGTTTSFTDTSPTPTTARRCYRVVLLP